MWSLTLSRSALNKNVNNYALTYFRKILKMEADFVPETQCRTNYINFNISENENKIA
jgi:hypothetical protein